MYRSALQLIYRKRFAKFKGPGFTCNICNHSYSRFASHHPKADIRDAIYNNHVIAGYGENRICPNCMSTSRERLVIAILQERLEVAQKSILHFSPEKKVFHYLKDKARVTTVDIMPGFYKHIDSGVRYADATHLEYANEHFDMVIANHIMEHIPRDLKAMREILRVLKKEGLAILQVPYSETILTTIEERFINDPEKQKQLFGQKDHVRIYSLQDYIFRLTKTGFRVEVITPAQLEHLRKFAIQPEESFFLCYKSS